MPLHVVENDLLRMDVDVIVNPANSRLAAGGGVCGAIFEGAGYREMQAACDEIGGCPPGKAVITPGFGLKQPYVIHTVGPIWQGGGYGEADILADAYRNSLSLAEKHGLRSIAFPLISAGIFGYPKDAAFRIALDTIRAFLLERDERELDVSLVLLDRKAVSLGRKLFGEIGSYLEENGFDENPWLNSRRRNEASILDEQRRRQERMRDLCTGKRPQQEDKKFSAVSTDAPEGAPSVDEARSCQTKPFSPRPGAGPVCVQGLTDLLIRSDEDYPLGESFSACLLRMIDERNLRDPQVYKAANIDRKLFSKIRSNQDYQPKKDTAIALAIGLGLDLKDTQALLETAGYTLSRSSKADMIIRGCLERGVHDIFEINEILFRYDQQPLGV